MNPDLRDFLALLDDEGKRQIIRLDDAAEPLYELTALALELQKVSGGQGPAVYCSRVGDFSMPVVSNVLGARQRYALALGVEESEIGAAWQMRESSPFPPRLVDSGPVHDVVLTGDQIDLGQLPILTHFAEDAGPYITAGILVAKDPESGVRNGSFHRCLVKDRTTLATSLHSRRHLWQLAQHADGKGAPLEVAIVNGAHPLFYLGCGMWKGPIDTDEYDITGGFYGEPMEVVRCKTIDLDVPANAEVVIEGIIQPGVHEPEGPFGEFTGYASHNSTNHRIDVTAITMRGDAIWQDIVSGISAEHNGALRVPQEARILRALRSQHPTVRAVSYPLSGACRFHCYISLKTTVQGQAKNAAFHALAEDLSLKLVVVVDDDIDVFNEEEVWWAVATRMQADQDIVIASRSAGAMLDPSSDEGLTAKMMIDATRPLKGWKAERCTLPPAAIADAQRRVAALLGDHCA